MTSKITIEYVLLKTLKPFAGNPRSISEGEMNSLRRSLREFGFVDPVICRRKDKMIIGGHQRVEAAKLESWADPVPVVFLSGLSDERASLLNVALNKIGGEFDMAKLSELFGDLSSGFPDLDLSITGFGEDDLNGLLHPAGEIIEDDVPEPPKKPVTKPGDLWLLGEHRLLCGDSTLVDVCYDDKASMVVTDPPYGVAYVGKTQKKLTLANDDMDEASLCKMIKAVFDVCEQVSKPGAYWMATVPPGPLHLCFAGDWKARGILRQIMVWVKDSMVLGHSEYHYKHEPILFGWTPGPRLNNTDRTKTTVWEHNRPKASREHPTMKPVGLFAGMIANHTRAGELVFEPFLGSGTTLIAAEQLGRKCYGLEIEPAYCDVTVQRWEKLTGKKAQRERT